MVLGMRTAHAEPCTYPPLLATPQSRAARPSLPIVTYQLSGPVRININPE